MQEIFERQAKERNKQLEADVREVLGTAAGRRVLISLLAKSGVWSRLGCADGDAVRLAYASGRRDEGADVLGFCNRVAAGLVGLAQQENNERVARWNEELEAARVKIEEGRDRQ
ncbi:MAG TPA: hypothetical protein P5026_10745 [Kiritimatiellia bacterium]|nr:hypothetical protein [Kiritimatiellia bacterium]HRU71392.1 hypothetical protein [Kiritimatiellia bacterium]